jgi:hypothetical protein
VKHGSKTSLFRLFPTIQLGGVPERTAVLAFSLFRVQGPFLQNYNSEIPSPHHSSSLQALMIKSMAKRESRSRLNHDDVVPNRFFEKLMKTDSKQKAEAEFRYSV